MDQGEHELRKPNVQEGQDQEYGVDFDGHRTHDALEEAQEGELRRTGHEAAGQGITSSQREEGIGRVVETGGNHRGGTHEALKEGQRKASDVIVGEVRNLVSDRFVSVFLSGEPGHEDHQEVREERKKQEEEQRRIQCEVLEGHDDGAGQGHIDVDRADHPVIFFSPDVGLFQTVAQKHDKNER